ncbi:MAG: DevR family CRISPR-associated autoregulator [Methanocellales archaeon]|nr:DevR family CRISPR-associated autoregulator [Methanocellales archaeon]
MEKKSKETVYEIAILGRATWNLHSLSNEGTVGNVTEPRTIILADGTQTDGVSGEILKHMHAEYMWALENNKDNFCEVCKKFRPERADGNPKVRKKSNAEDAVKEAIECELCDVHGFLVQRPPATRESTIEFGWAVGIPYVQRSIHVHSRHALHEAYLEIDEEREEGKWEKEKCSVRECKTEESESKLYKVKNRWYCETHLPVRTPQMLYHRPTRSGAYGVVSVFQPWRIGLNNVNFIYDINDDDKRKFRYKLALKAYQAMFMRPEGAMTSTRLPHTENFEGVIVVSKTNFPVPVISPLKDDYKEQINSIKATIDSGNSIDIIKFDSISNFVEKMDGLLDKGPYKVEFE